MDRLCVKRPEGLLLLLYSIDGPAGSSQCSCTVVSWEPSIYIIRKKNLNLKYSLLLLS